MQKTIIAVTPSSQKIHKKTIDEFEYRAFVAPAKANVVIKWNRK
jgi:hypothetical protein